MAELRKWQQLALDEWTRADTASGVQAIELSGHLNVLKENLGFGTYSRVDRSFRFPASVMLPDGEVQITDPTGSVGVWNVVREGRNAWVTKVLGTPDIADLSFLQLIRSFDGRLLLKVPNTGRIRRG